MVRQKGVSARDESLTELVSGEFRSVAISAWVRRDIVSKSPAPPEHPNSCWARTTTAEVRFILQC
jgi:hypothetical protein